VLPGWRFLRFPEKTVVFISLSVALLAGLGAQRLFESLKERKWAVIKIFHRRLLLFAAFNLVFLGAFSSGGLDKLLLILSGASLETHTELKELSTAISVSIFSGALFALLAWILTFPVRRLPYCIVQGLICLTVILSLAAGTYGPMRMNLGKPEALTDPPNILNSLQEKTGKQTIYGVLRLYSHYEPDEAVKLLKKNSISKSLSFLRQVVLNLTNGSNGLFQIENATGFIPLTAQGRQSTAVEELSELIYFHGFNVRAAQRLIDSPTDPERTFELLFDDRAGDRIRLVQAVPVASQEEAIALANTPNFNSVTTIPVETDAPDFSNQAPMNAQLEVLHYAPERISVRTSSDTSTTLFIADAYADGWSATVDGKPTPIYPGLIAGRAIGLPAGSHDVQLIYKTPGLRVGMVLSGIGWTLILGLAFFGWRRRCDEQHLRVSA
jgi:hypothetical protein